jgi:integrase
LGVRKPRIAVKPYRHSSKHKFIVDLRAFGKGRKFFKHRSEAEAEAMRQKTLLERHSREAVGLSQREMSEIIATRSKLAEYGKTLSEAGQFYIDHLERVLRHGVTVEQLAAEVIKAKHRDGRSKLYLDDLRKRLDRFSQDFGNRTVAGITVEELDNWLRDLPLSPKSRSNYRTNIGILFNYAFRRRMIDHNPIVFTAKPKLIDKAPEIFAVDELRALLEAAATSEPDVLPMLAIGAFSGLRAAEIRRLHWKEIDLARGFVEVTAAKSKTARRRLVPIQPNLAEWLRPCAGMTGPVVPVMASRGKLRRVRRIAGVRWPNNGLRHSFASYRLAAIHDAPRVASELGHTNPQLLYAHYRELVRPEEAERYWKIAPVIADDKTIAFSSVR